MRGENPPLSLRDSALWVYPGTFPKSRAQKQRPIHHPSHCFWHAGRVGGLLGYTRVSTTEQKAHLQTDGLKKAGCVRVV